MARIRTIKPEFFTSEDIVFLSPLARLLYIALWVEADREGRLVWKPATFKLRYFPGDDCQIELLCKELVERGLVIQYGNGYAHIPSFKSHQHINPRESASQLPKPDEKSTRAPRVGTRQSRVGTGANLDGHPQGGKEGKERNDDDASSFAQFYQAYPKKTAKPAAEKAFTAVKANGHLTNILKDIARRKLGDDWQKENGKYIPNPATYLQQRRWEDEVASPVKAEPKPWDGAR